MNFITDELIPLVVEHMDTVFPERQWTLKGNRWSSPFHTDGTASKSGARERSFIVTSSSYSNRVGETDGGESVGIMDYALMYKGYGAGAKGEAFRNTLQYLCDKVGLEMPTYNSDEYEQYKAHQEEIEKLYTQMQKALFEEEGRVVLRYLTEQRGYSEDLIRKMGLGFISKDVAEKINNTRLPLSYNPKANEEIKNGTRTSVPYGVGRSHQLVVPYISNNGIRGFKFREIKKNYNKDSKELPKYYNNYGLPKSMYLYGFKGFHLSGNRQKNLDITVVEGELDALHAQVMGIENIVAAAGGTFSTQVLQQAKNKGVVRVTLLFDTEENEEKQKETYKKIEKAIRDIRSMGLTPFVAELPTEGGKMDVDEYLKTHSADDLRTIIDNAIPASYFLFTMQLKAAQEKETADNTITFKNLDEFKRQTIILANSEYTTPTERTLIFQNFETVTNSTIPKEIIREEADKENDDALSEKNQELCQKKIENLLNTVKTKGWQEAVNSLETLNNELRKSLHVTSDIDYLADDVDEIFESYKQTQKVIKSHIELSDRNGLKYRFIMPSGGITVIGAPTNHGKSKMLQFLALDAAQNNDDGTIVYLTYEERKESVIKQMLNIYANQTLTRQTTRYGNMTSISEYLHDGTTTYIKTEELAAFKHNVERFKQLLHSRKIKVIKPKDNYLSTLKTIFNSVLSQQQTPIKGIFLDYVQELYIENTKWQRTDELKEIMVEIGLIAQKYNIPIVMAAQLNRETSDGPLTLSNQSIADSSWIERKADEILLIWSNKEKCKRDPDGKKTKQANEEIPGLDLGSGGKIYTLLTKSRQIPTNTFALLDINGNTGRITGNYTADETQTELSFVTEDEEPF